MDQVAASAFGPVKNPADDELLDPPAYTKT